MDTYFIIADSWATFAVVGAIVGHSRGRVVAGTLWALLLGPIGVVVACFMRSGDERAADARREEVVRGPSAPVEAGMRVRDERPRLGD